MISSRSSLQTHADIEAHDRSGALVAIVEVKAAGTLGDAERQLAAWVGELQMPVPYALAVDRHRTSVYTPKAKMLGDAVVLFHTPDLLRSYDAEFESKQIFHDYFVVLVESWLRDVAYQWKHQQPPGMDDLRRIGLADRLQGGHTQSSASYRSSSYSIWDET